MNKIHCICINRRAFKRVLRECEMKDIEVREVVHFGCTAYSVTLCIRSATMRRYIKGLQKLGGVVFYKGRTYE